MGMPMDVILFRKRGGWRNAWLVVVAADGVELSKISWWCGFCGSTKYSHRD